MSDKWYSYWYVCSDCDASLEVTANIAPHLPPSCICGSMRERVTLCNIKIAQQSCADVTPPTSTERSTTMTMIDPIVNAVTEQSKDWEDSSTFKATIESQRNTISQYANKMDNLVDTLNSRISDEEASEEDTITYGDLSEILEECGFNPLTFKKEYEAIVRFTVQAVVRYSAAGDDDARETADSIELNIDDDQVSYIGDAEVTELSVEDTRVRSVEQQ